MNHENNTHFPDSNRNVINGDAQGNIVQGQYVSGVHQYAARALPPEDIRARVAQRQEMLNELNRRYCKLQSNLKMWGGLGAVSAVTYIDLHLFGGYIFSVAVFGTIVDGSRLANVNRQKKGILRDGYRLN